MKALRKSLSIPGSSLTFTLDSLEKKGLIKRTRNRIDRRQWLLSFTAKGRRFYSTLVQRQTQAVVSSLEKFSDDERAAFLKIAEEISQAGELPLSVKG